MLRPLQPEGSLTSLDPIPNHAISGRIFILFVFKTHFNCILPLSPGFLKWHLPFTLSRSLRVPWRFHLVLRHYIRKKVKVNLVQALRPCTGRTAHRGSRGIALHFLDHSTRRGWGVSVTPRPLFTSGKDPVPIVQEAGWAPGPVWTGAENLAPTGIRSPDRPARSQSLYRLSYPAHSTLHRPRISGAQHQLLIFKFTALWEFPHPKYQFYQRYNLKRSITEIQSKTLIDIT